MSANINQRKCNSQIEITDLIAEAVQNASARRNQVLDAKEPLLAFSEEEANGIMGGQVGKADYTTCGIISCDPPFLS
ncbi:hypothetical protein [Chlorogloea sp. CCALA 695]|uniref:hypothetical protein n=1 Tax=Chlorogloea sp. CCALA 695 TaxID=2107693 RepID=UPI000D073302|nr:hypothetical protein [Chlorogloea sp. CCALA 695]PSB27519.1 hypothetical protein C7B70_22375 [Chlorogloea sp. CCALA 695]